MDAHTPTPATEPAVRPSARPWRLFLPSAPRVPRPSRLPSLLYWPALLTLLLGAYAVAALWPHLIEGRLRKRVAVSLILTTVASAACVHLAGRRLRAAGRRRFVFAHLAFALAAGVSLLALRAGLAATVPPWPKCDLRPVAVGSGSGADRAGPPETLSYYHWFHGPYNSWGMRDFERAVGKPAGACRILCVGDSFLEGCTCRSPVSLLAEMKYHDRHAGHVELVNLGVCATGPIQYHHRVKQVGLRLSPDAVFLFLYAGNDFLRPDEAYPADERLSRWVAERPVPSILGELSPRLAWLASNRVGLSEIQRNNKHIPNEFEDITKATRMPFEQGVRRLAELMHANRHPQVPVERIEEVLRRGGPAFWSALGPKLRDPEFLQPWILDGLLARELNDDRSTAPDGSVREEEIGPHVASTLTWVRATRALCEQHGIPLVVFLAPVGDVDPAYVEFWKPWPAYYSFNVLQSKRLDRLHARLKEEGFAPVDLRETLGGVPGTYRLTDAHWNEKGHDLVAERMLPEVRRVVERRGR